MVLESYAVQAWGLLWCFYSDGLSEQLITPIRAFQFDNSSFLHASFSTRALGAVLYNILAQKMVEYRPASDRSFLRIERAYFTQFSLCFDNSDDVFGIMVFDELVKKKFELKVRARGWIILLIRKVECVVAWYAFLSYYKNLLDLSNRSMFCLYGLHDCNSVHYQRGLTSIVLRCCLHYSRLIMISYADATLVGELLSISVYTVYAITFDGSCLIHFMTTATLILYN